MKDLDIFSALSLAERDEVGKLAIKKIYKKNEFIFREGEAADSIYLIKYGRVRVFKISDEGKELTLDFFKAEDILGEAMFFENALHTMNAMAVEDTFICCCTKELFSILLHNPQSSLKIIQYLVQKANNYTEHLSRMAFMDVRGRIIDLLFKLDEKYGTPSPLGSTISIDLTHQDVGSLVNASRVMVTNVLSELRKEKLVHINGHRITILNQPSAM
jgi:CRP/FNR family transcriptional regulator